MRIMDQTAENLRRIRAYNKALDEWDESKHPRAANGQFGSGGGKATKSSNKRNAESKNVTPKGGLKLAKEIEGNYKNKLDNLRKELKSEHSRSELKDCRYKAYEMQIHLNAHRDYYSDPKLWQKHYKEAAALQRAFEDKLDY